MAHRYFLDTVTGSTATITGDEANHLIRVMRVLAGDKLLLSDKSGFDYDAVVTDIRDKTVICTVGEKMPNPAQPNKRLTVYMALPKGDKLEFITQKMCELGASELTPFVSEFCVAQKSKKEDTKRTRLQKISDEACKQCGRSSPMAVNETLTFKQILPQLKTFDKVVLLYEHGAQSLKSIDFSACQNVALIIGSEGGFSQREADLMVENGRTNIILGSRILRCETAAVTGASLVMYLLGEFD